MKIELWVIGKTSFPYLKEGIDLYAKRLQHYVPFKLELLADVKNAKSLSEAQLKLKEGEVVLKKLQDKDHLVLLDERGKDYSSVQFAQLLEQKLQQSHKRIIFLIGGAYGFSEAIYKRSNSKISLSKMTFSHQMIRLFMVEQLYRAMTILRGEPYHHR